MTASRPQPLDGRLSSAAMEVSFDGIGEPRVARSEALARSLEAKIIEGSLEAGARLGTKQELRVRFGVAVATLNEAVRMLEMRGFVEARPGPGGGVFVSTPPADVRFSHLILKMRSARENVEDTLVVRNALELAVAQAAAANATARDITELDALVDRMQEVVEDPDAFLRANWALHRRMAAIGHNATLSSIYTGLLDMLEAWLDRAEPGKGLRASQNVKVHRELVAAVASDDEARIKRAVKRHDPLAHAAR